MPYQDMQPAPAAPLKHYRRDYIPSSSVPGIGYPTSGQEVYGQVPQIPDSFPYEEMTPPPPEMLERLRSTDRGFPMQVPAPRQIDPRFYGPRTSTTIVIPPGSNAKNREMLEGLSKEIGKGMEGLSPIIEALMGMRGKK